jgi:glycosyltransferase domain-containing protein
MAQGINAKQPRHQGSGSFHDMDTSSPLTIVIPTRNRPRYCLALLRFLRDSGTTHPIVIADSSNFADAELIRFGCAGDANYTSSDAATDMFTKLAQVAASITTPFVVMLPDDDVTFPHAINDCLIHLQTNSDFAAAHGYVLRFGINNNDVDIHNVFSFTPTIAAQHPLYRLYYLMQRYQPFIWAVFRTETFAAAMQVAAATRGTVFKELAFMSHAILSGKVARLPVVFAMRGMEESLTHSTESDPFLWFLRDPSSFYTHYAAYRNELVQFIRSKQRDGLEPDQYPQTASSSALLRQGVEPETLLDLIHATLLGRTIDLGMVNHQVQLLLGEPLPPIALEKQWLGARQEEPGDVVNSSNLANRRYIWRRAMREAEPRHEITISPDEMRRVEDQLDLYRLD